MSKIETRDAVAKPRGVFTMVVRNRRGEVVESYSDRNMIVNSAKVALAHLIGGDDQPGKKVSKFACGTSTVGPDPTDTEVTDAYVNAIKSHEYPTVQAEEGGAEEETGSVKFKWVLDYDENNGTDISEFGLLCEDGTLFAHKIRRPIAKASDLAFEGTWTIYF